MNGTGAAFLDQYLIQLLTAVTLILIGGWLFEARDGFFLSGGQFRGKIAGLILLLLAVAGVATISPFIDQFWAELVYQFEETRIVGMLLVLGMFSVNKSAEWNYFDVKSLVVYIIGLALLVQPGPVAGLL